MGGEGEGCREYHSSLQPSQGLGPSLWESPTSVRGAAVGCSFLDLSTAAQLPLAVRSLGFCVTV